MQKMETINDHVHLAKEKSKTDAEFYKIQKQAEANKLLLSKEYLELKKVEAMATNNKVSILFMRVPLYNTHHSPRSTLGQIFRTCSSAKTRTPKG